MGAQENIARFQEIANRGLQDNLDPDKRARFDEGVRRGIIVVKPTVKSDIQARPFSEFQSKGFGVKSFAEGDTSDLGREFQQSLQQSLRQTQEGIESGSIFPEFQDLPFDVAQRLTQENPSIPSRAPRDEVGFAREDAENLFFEDKRRRAANIERIRLDNPELAKMIEGMSALEVSDVGVGKQASDLFQGLGRVFQVLDAEDIRETPEYDALKSVRPAATVGEGLTTVATSAIPAAKAAQMSTVPARAAGSLGVGALEAGLPSLGRGETVGEAAKQTAIAAGLQFAGGELFNYGKPTPKQLKIKKALELNPRDPDLAKHITKAGDPAFNAKIRDAIKQTGRSDLVAVANASSSADKSAIRKMVMSVKRLKKDPLLKGIEQPRNVVGDSLGKRVQTLSRMNKQAGSQIDRVARNQLKGKTVNLSSARDQFKSAMDDLRVGYDPDSGVVTFSGSALEGSNAGASRSLIKRLASRMKSTDMDAADAHFMKRLIDKEVTFGKSPSGLAGDIDDSIKGLRSNVNDSIRDVSKAYKNANSKYSDTITAMDNLQSAAGSKVDLSSPEQLGRSARRISGNTQSGQDLLASYKEIDDVLKKYKVRFKDDLVTQAQVANMLEERFKTQGATTFKSEVGKGLADVTTKPKTQLAIEKGGELIDKVAGVTDDKALDALLKILD